MSLLDDTLGTKEDLKLPEGELGQQIKEAFDKEGESGGILVRCGCFHGFGGGGRIDFIGSVGRNRRQLMMITLGITV